jgi:hypothetical protein
MEGLCAQPVAGPPRPEPRTTPRPADTSGIHLDIHSYSQLVLWPWGEVDSASRPTAPALQTLGRRFAWFNGYTPQQSIGLYPTDGTSDAVSYGELGVAYTFELGTSFFESCTSFNKQHQARQPAGADVRRQGGAHALPHAGGPRRHHAQPGRRRLRRRCHRRHARGTGRQRHRHPLQPEQWRRGRAGHRQRALQHRRATLGCRCALAADPGQRRRLQQQHRSAFGQHQDQISTFEPSSTMRLVGRLQEVGRRRRRCGACWRTASRATAPCRRRRSG